LIVFCKKIQQEYEVAASTLRNWNNEGKIEARRTPGGKQLYNIDDVAKIFHKEQEPTKERSKTIYARVSTNHQQADLERQIQDLRKAYPDHEVISEVASGINFERKKFNTLLDRVIAVDIKEIVISHRDRLSRFGFEFFTKLCKKFDCGIMVHCNNEDTSETHELSEDLFAVVTVFVGKHHGCRGAEQRKKRRAAQEEEENTRK
jgi:putative resolvase